MVLTFSREGGGNRIKEQDEWVREIKAHHTLSFEQVCARLSPGWRLHNPGRTRLHSQCMIWADARHLLHDRRFFTIRKNDRGKSPGILAGPDTCTGTRPGS